MSKSKGNVIDPLDIVDGISLDGCSPSAPRASCSPDEARIEKATRRQFPTGLPPSGPMRCA